ncbi:hypothetical protein AWC05_26065 [Mycobacterium florentinum]|uniref:Uncharacterized protein n=1 Tax=Mycobacterium florentinum TaxID=292462 RepID=A0A1X1U4A3_MYCFL|nr:hypothetical protein [Mycobacterium florentinum]MCV7410867.1 hypothetical protein [Mycobacterium florentinum]ORV51651.1 hypothetical protein AWC05_26065 [Mycobacterium florentinum]BBX80202.1 hypothetical protein MFLOJ_39890 [Mycobacterium florentinum]
MLHNNESHYPIGEAVWAVAGILLLFAFGDVLVLLALALVIAGIGAAWLSYRQVQRDERGDDDLAPVTRIHPAAVAHRDLNAAPWQGPSAA